jgi:hypothetical protein
VLPDLCPIITVETTTDDRRPTTDDRRSTTDDRRQTLLPETTAALVVSRLTFIERLLATPSLTHRKL